MNNGTMSIKRETIFGEEYIVIDVQGEEGTAKAHMTRENAVKLAETLLKMAWKCNFVILKDDEMKENA